MGGGRARAAPAGASRDARAGSRRRGTLAGALNHPKVLRADRGGAGSNRRPLSWGGARGQGAREGGGERWQPILRKGLILSLRPSLPPPPPLSLSPSLSLAAHPGQGPDYLSYTHSLSPWQPILGKGLIPADIETWRERRPVVQVPRAAGGPRGRTRPPARGRPAARPSASATRAPAPAPPGGRAVSPGPSTREHPICPAQRGRAGQVGCGKSPCLSRAPPLPRLGDSALRVTRSGDGRAPM